MLAHGRRGCLGAHIDELQPHPRSPAGYASGWPLWIGLFAVYVFWGSGYLGIRVMVRDIPPMLGSGLRYIVSGALLLGWCAFRARRRGTTARAATRIDRREFAGLFSVGMLLVAGGTGLLAIGEKHVASSLAALLGASVPLWVILFRAAVRERTPALGLVGAGVGFAGVGLLFLPGHLEGGTSLLAAMLVLVSAALWALGSWIVPRIALPADIALTTGWQMVLGGVGLSLIGLAAGDAADLKTPSAASAAAVVYLVFVSGLIGYSAFVWLLHNAPIGQVSTYAYVNPLVAVTLGWAILDEHIAPMTLVAAAVIVGSVALTLRSERELIPPPAAPPSP
jgi:drug/metabolite transporter (DMT)-like permease